MLKMSKDLEIIHFKTPFLSFITDGGTWRDWYTWITQPGSNRNIGCEAEKMYNSDKAGSKLQVSQVYTLH